MQLEHRFPHYSEMERMKKRIDFNGVVALVGLSSHSAS